ncbi:MAG: hypothetical protein AAGJ96_05465 [Pseudomonadota bacterium]
MSVEITLSKLCAQSDKVHAAAIGRGDALHVHSHPAFDALDYPALFDQVDTLLGACDLACDGTDETQNIYVEHDAHGLLAAPLDDDLKLFLVTDPVLGAGLDKLRVNVNLFARRLVTEFDAAPKSEVDAADGMRAPLAERPKTSTEPDAEKPVTVKTRMYRGVAYEI